MQIALTSIVLPLVGAKAKGKRLESQVLRRLKTLTNATIFTEFLMLSHTNARTVATGIVEYQIMGHLIVQESTLAKPVK